MIRGIAANQSGTMLEKQTASGVLTISVGTAFVITRDSARFAVHRFSCKLWIGSNRDVYKLP